VHRTGIRNLHRWEKALSIHSFAGEFVRAFCNGKKKPRMETNRGFIKKSLLAA